MRSGGSTAKKEKPDPSGVPDASKKKKKGAAFRGERKNLHHNQKGAAA